MAYSLTPILRTVSALFIAAFALMLSSHWAAAAGWENSRELSMRLKEAGRPVEAYQAAAGFKSGKDADMFDREFVCGWIALRNLNRPDIALEHFKKMASHIAGIKSDRQGVAKAKAGYWLGRTVGHRVEDQPDYAYGKWLAEVYGKVVATRAPSLDDVDAVITWPQQPRISYRYRRLVMPFESKRDSTLLLSATVIDPAIDLRVKPG